MLDLLTTAACFLARETIPIAGGILNTTYATATELLFGTHEERDARVHIIGGTILRGEFYLTVKHALEARSLPASIHVPLGMITHTRDIPRYLATLSTLFGKRNIVVGHSLGGRAAVEALAQHPDIIDRAILMGTPLDGRHAPTGARAFMRRVLGIDLDNFPALRKVLETPELKAKVVIVASKRDSLLAPAVCGTELFDHIHVVDNPPHTRLADAEETLGIIERCTRDTFSPRRYPRVTELAVARRQRGAQSDDTCASDMFPRRPSH